MGTAVSMGWAPALFEASADWHGWLPLTGVLVLCWGLVAAATAALFGGPAGGRGDRSVAAARDDAAVGVARVAQRYRPTNTACGGSVSPNSSQAGGRDG